MPGRNGVAHASLVGKLGHTSTGFWVFFLLWKHVLYIAVISKISCNPRRSLIKRRLVGQVLHYDSRWKALVVSLMYSNMGHVNVHRLGSCRLDFFLIDEIQRHEGVNQNHYRGKGALCEG